jgi:hypothetical protein
LTWWNIIILVLGIGILEYFFLSYKKTSGANKAETPPSNGYLPPDF